MQNFEYIHNEAASQRLDVLLTSLLGHSRNHIQRSIKNGEVKINSQVVTKTGQLVWLNDCVTALLSSPDVCVSDIVPLEMDLEILFEDEHLVVVNKPAGLSVHPSSSERSKTLVNALVHRYGNELSDLNNAEILRPGIVHRLDKDTTGLMLVARNNFAHRCLAKQLAERTLKRTYWALTVGNFKENNGRIETIIGRHPKDRKKMAVLDEQFSSGRKAITNWTLIDEVQGYSLLEVKLETGRTHQIRVHLDHINHPIVGDQLYGGQRSKTPFIARQCLHSKEISFFHPLGEQELSFKINLPPDFTSVLMRLGFDKKYFE